MWSDRCDFRSLKVFLGSWQLYKWHYQIDLTVVLSKVRYIHSRFMRPVMDTVNSIQSDMNPGRERETALSTFEI